MKTTTSPRGWIAYAVRPSLLLWALLWLQGAIIGCQRKADTLPADPSGNVLTYAQTVALYRHDGFSRVVVQKPFHDQKGRLEYLLVPRGATTPPGFPNAIRVDVPVRSVAPFGLPFLAMLDTLGAAELVIGVYDTAAVHSPRIRHRIAEGKVRHLGNDFQLDPEVLLALQPDLTVMSATSASRYSQLAPVRARGIPILLESGYLEPHPLGRAEWLRVLAAFLQQDARGDRLFQAIAQAYEDLARRTAGVQFKPTVVAGLIVKDVWYVPGGRSYMAQFLRDAGADYAWTGDTTSGSIHAAFEAVYPLARVADVWLNPNHREASGGLLSQDPRFQKFRALQTGRVYGYYRRVRPGGGNDYWESGVINPHIVLADLICILHPDLLPQHQLVYYRPIQ